MKDVLSSIGAENDVLAELLEYTKNRFEKNSSIPEKIEQEPFIEVWKGIVEQAEKYGIASALNKNVPHGDEDIILENPQGVKIEIYNSIAGAIPVIYAINTSDFEQLVVKLIRKGKAFPGIEKTGASFAHGETNRFIILSNKPYSNIPAEKLGLEDKKWREMSLILRREHECTHYFTKRFLGSSQNNVHDELVADFAGILSAAGEYHADWFLIGLGIDKYPNSQKEGRMKIYTGSLSEKALDIIKKITIKVANNVEAWSKTEVSSKLTLREKILFLCGHSLFELYSM